MRNTIFTLLFLLPFLCDAQDNHETKFDTVKVVMLVTDTANHINRSAYWITGYTVTAYMFIPAYNQDDKDGSITVYDDHWEPRRMPYLDSGKNKLNKSIIVWNTTEIH